ncbi:MAG: ATP-binding protein [Lachnospiraceae bacterium]|nr:ATP-binding protein [Lachnospiraceae bacterium]
MDNEKRHAENNLMEANTDYTGCDGLLVCGVCGERKETWIDLSILKGTGEKKKVPCMCKCQQESRNKIEEEYERKEEMIRIGRLREASLIDSKFNNARFENFKQTKNNQMIYKICHEYAETFDQKLKNNNGLLLCGEVGTGKSFAAACIANYLLDRGIPVIMTSFVRLVDMYRSWEDCPDIINQFQTVKLVIFDDLGAERDTDYSLEKVYDIVDRRYNSGLPMILTTNRPMEEILQETDIRYKRIYDRIMENCPWVNFTGASWRKKHGFKEMEKMQNYMNGG